MASGFFHSILPLPVSLFESTPKGLIGIRTQFGHWVLGRPRGLEQSACSL